MNVQIPKFGFATCSYCKGKMKPATVRVKRPVPPEAKDLGLYDEEKVLQCVNCNSTVAYRSVFDFGGCNSCSSATISSLYADTLPDQAVRLGTHYVSHDYEDESSSGGCTKCVRCDECKRPLMTHDYRMVQRKYKETSSRGNEERHTHNYYFHSECIEKWLLNQRTQQEMQQTQQRVANGLCTKCGKTLGFADRLYGRESHKSC